MKNQANAIGVITYKNYEERVIIDNNFNIDELYAIIENDKDFVSFHIEGETENQKIAKPRVVTREEETIGTTYNAYNENPLTFKTKVTWKVTGGAYFKTKKEAEKYCTKMNNSDRLLLVNKLFLNA